MTDFFKMFEFFFSTVMGSRQIGSRTQEISIEILNQIRRVLILVLISLGALTMFCMGVSQLIERGLNNMDNGTYFFTPSIWVILAFLGTCALILVYSTNKKVWFKIFRKDIEKPVPSANTFGGGQLESVISLLILDIVKEREASRQRESEKREHSKEE